MSETEISPEMEITPNKPLAIGWRILLCLVAGVLLALSFPPFPTAFLLPLAIALLLGTTEGVKPRVAGYLGFVSGLAFFGIALWWLRNVFGNGAIGLWAICALFPMLFCGLTAWLRQRLPQIPFWLLAPIVWTGIELFRSEIMVPAFPWMGLGYALVGVRMLAPLASVVGSYGLSFLVVCFGAILLRVTQRQLEKGPLIPCLLLLGWMGIFFVPRAPLLEPQNGVSIRLVQTSPGDEDGLLERSTTAEAQIMLWPEDSLTDPQQDPKLWAKLTDLVKTKKCYLAFGAKVMTDPKDPAAFRKTAFLLDPNGQVIGQQVKFHTIPFMREGEAGKEVKAVATTVGKLGTAICYDLDFPDVARRLTADGAELLLAPSDNPAEWGRTQHLQHRQLFQMRAIECGRWIGTADVAGNTFVITPQGQIQVLYDERQYGIIATPLGETENIGRETGKTIFVLGGWRFGQFCLLLLTLCFVWACFPRRSQIR